jgi:hypothetical protein
MWPQFYSEAPELPMSVPFEAPVACPVFQMNPNLDIYRCMLHLVSIWPSRHASFVNT